jgi:hypothetical protein
MKIKNRKTVYYTGLILIENGFFENGVVFRVIYPVGGE